MTEKPLNVALIGCGRIAGHHCQSIAAVDHIRLAAVCDLDEDKAKAWAKEYDVPFYTNYRTMFTAHPEIDIAAVITPSGMHLEHAREMMESYGKHVIVE